MYAHAITDTAQLLLVLYVPSIYAIYLLILVQGKTDVAMLSILRVIDQHLSSKSESQQLSNSINRKAFKIIYV